MSLDSTKKALLDRKISTKELTEEYIKRIKKEDDKTNSFITISEERAFCDAKKAQDLIEKKEQKALTGIPYSVKDNISTKGIKTTCASKMLENYCPIYDAEVVRKVDLHSGIMLGKTNMDEFGMGSANKNSYFGEVKNPIDNTRIPGGSSGGAAVSVAKGFAEFALASDTGGSVRQPAAFCGVVGLKPTYSRISRQGLIAYASSLDTIGIITKSAHDAKIVLDAISGKDSLDMTSRFCEKYENIKDFSNITIGVPREFFAESVNKKIREAVFSALEIYKNAGCKILEVSIPSFEDLAGAYYVISTSEAASNLARYDGIRFGVRGSFENSYDENIISARNVGFGKEVKKRIMLGNFFLENYDKYVLKANNIRKKVTFECEEIFKKCDCIITPTTPKFPPKLDDNSKKDYKDDVFTVVANLAGLPAISVPCGVSEENLPIGLSIMGKEFSEELIIFLAEFLEKTFDKKEVMF